MKSNNSDEHAAEAQAQLDQIREEAGMPRRGDEIAQRRGLASDDPDAFGDPPLDWRLTPRNVLLQVLAIAFFLGVVWFFVSLLTDSWSAVLEYVAP